MADENTENQNTDPNLNNEDPVEKAKREKDQAFQQLRHKDELVREKEGRIAELERELQLRDTRKETKSEPTLKTWTGEEPEPDPNENVTDWLRWDRAKSRREIEQLQARLNINAQVNDLNQFAVASENQARTAHPDYEDSQKYLFEDYKAELDGSGELDELAYMAENDPNQKQVIDQFALNNQLTRHEAARELCARGVYESRRQTIVRNARRTNKNPAEKAYEMAVRRGFKGGQQANRNLRSSTEVDQSLAEMERRRNLRNASETLSETRGTEPKDERVYTRAELEDLARTNKAEYNRAIKRIAQRENPTELSAILTR